MDIRTIFVDMDEVLCDFVGAALRVHGWTPKQLAAVQTPGKWSIVEPLGLTLEQFWQPIHLRGESFWIDIEPLPWMDDVLTLIQDTVGDKWFIVTAPSRCPTSYTGKVKWIKWRFGDHFDRFLLTPHKELLAKQDTVLIDDRDFNVMQFNKAGGTGVVFPTLGNSHANLAHRPLQHLKETLHALQVS